MVRLLGVEIATLLILGFTIGALVFMYLNTRKELSELHDDNDRLQNQLLESSSVSKTAHYQEKLVQSDLKQLQIKDRDSVARISNLTQQVKNMLEQLDKVKTERHAEQEKFDQLSAQNNEMQGIQDELITDLDETRGKLRKCEGSKNSAAKVANLSNKKKMTELEKKNRELTAQLESSRTESKNALGRLEMCERLQQRDKGDAQNV